MHRQRFSIFTVILLFVAFLGQVQASVSGNPCDSVIHSYDDENHELAVHGNDIFADDDHSGEEDCCNTDCCNIDCACADSLCSTVIYLAGHLAEKYPVTYAEPLPGYPEGCSIFVSNPVYRPPIHITQDWCA